MIEPTQGIAQATTAGSTGARAAAVKGAKSFAGELAKAAVSSKPETRPAPRPDGEQTRKIAGHAYARIENGDDKGLFLNQMAGNPRQGSVFRMVERGDHVFHVYGTGADKVIIGMTPPAGKPATTS